MRAGRRPPRAHRRHTRAGEGFCVLPAAVARYHHREDVTCIEIDGADPATVALAYTRHRTMPEIENFAALARKHIAGTPRTSDGAPHRSRA
jgi:hypothetical protein